MRRDPSSRVTTVRPATRAAACLLLVVGVGAPPAAAADSGEFVRCVDEPIPLGERLVYDVRWLGLKAGMMTIEAFRESETENANLRIAMTARTTPFWDGIYKVRSRIDSWFDPATLSSVRYLDRSEQRGELEHQEFLLDPENGTVRGVARGQERRFDTELRPLVDPLAYIYRIRSCLAPDGEPIELNIVGSRAVERTVVEVDDRTTIKAMGEKRTVDVVVPKTEEGGMFGQKGQITLYLGADERRLPFRIEFDLSFGRLVAKLDAVETRPEVSVLAESRGEVDSGE
jgi:hypothetical protein